MARRRSSGASGKLLAGFVIILISVTAFAVYQALNSPSLISSVPTVTLAIPPSAVARPPAATAQSVEYKLVAEKANLVAPIINLYLDDAGNWDLTYLGQSVGYLQGTAALGQGGNFVLAGHVEMKDGSPGPFAYLARLKAGDAINIISNQASNPVVVEYAVSEIKTVKPTDFAEIQSHGHEELTLVTCSDWDQQSKAYLTRLVVHAKPVTNVLNKPLFPLG